MKRKLSIITVLLTMSFGVYAQTALIYALARPIGGGDIRLLETNIVSGTETVIASYTSAQLDDYDPGTTTFDLQNGRFLALSSDPGGTVSVIAIDVTNGNIDYSYTSPSHEFFSVEYSNGKAYSLARPIGGGIIKLMEIDLVAGSETVIDTYTFTELDDYDLGSTSFDHDNGRFLALASDPASNVSLVAINKVNGDIDYSYSSPGNELFGVEYSNGKVYSLARPIGGGDIRLLEIDLVAGSETVIDTYLSSEMDDYDPNTTCYDHQNGKFVVIMSDVAEDPISASVNTTNGDIDYTYVSSSYELFSVEVSGTVGVGQDEMPGVAGSVIVYPNPTANTFTVDIPIQSGKIEVVNMWGEVIIPKQGTTKIIDLSTFPKGVYLVRVSNERTTVSRSIVKQ